MNYPYSSTLISTGSNGVTRVFVDGEEVFPCPCGETHRGESIAYERAHPKPELCPNLIHKDGHYQCRWHPSTGSQDWCTMENQKICNTPDYYTKKEIDATFSCVNPPTPYLLSARIRGKT